MNYFFKSYLVIFRLDYFSGTVKELM